jgi:hypothetical protein
MNLPSLPSFEEVDLWVRLGDQRRIQTITVTRCATVFLSPRLEPPQETTSLLVLFRIEGVSSSDDGNKIIQKSPHDHLIAAEDCMGYRDRSGSEYPSHVRNTFHKRTRGIEHIGTLTDGIGRRASIKRPRLFSLLPILVETQHAISNTSRNIPISLSLTQDSFYTITHFLPQPRKRHNATLHLHLRGRRRPGRLCPGQPRRRQPSRRWQHTRQGCLHYRPRVSCIHFPFPFFLFFPRP